MEKTEMIMEREEAIEVYNGLLNQKIKEAFEFFAPELRESEDERIRKEIVDYFKKECECLLNDFRDKEDEKRLSFYNKALAYLEKQKEQKPSINIDQLKSLMLQYLQEAANEKDDSDIEADTDKWARKILGYDFEQKPWKVGENAYFDPNTEMWFIKEEQKPIPLMNGDADLYFDNWFQQMGQVTSRQCFEEGIKYAQRLQKEQKPEGVYVDCTEHPEWYGMPPKEQKPASTEDMPYITDEHFYEREPTDSFKYKLAEYMTKNCRKEESPYGYTYHISAETILEMAKEELIKRGELQKPVEIVNYPPDVIEACMLRYLQSAANRNDDREIMEDTKKYRKELLTIIMDIAGATKPVELSGELSTNDSSNPSGLIARNLTPEQMREETLKPVEWSEEDEGMLNFTKTQLRILQAHLSHAHSESMSDMEYSSKLLQIEKCVSWLDIRFKSLRPSSKPSDVCYGAKGDPDTSGVWKPSEEQMEALERASTNKYLSAKQFDILVSLYEQLKSIQ